MNLRGVFMILLGVFSLPLAAQTNVSEFADDTNTDPGIWYENDVRLAGMASIEDLTGLGGDLENNQPLPPGAALITTGFDNGDKAEVGVLDDYGMPNDITASLNVGYWFHKASNPGQNLFAAPAIKLTFFNPVCDDPASAGDCFGTLVYEPTWNGAGSSPGTPISSAVALDTWTQVNIDENTGLFWWTGGFGQPNTAGGPPINTLGGWLATFSSDFGDSTLIQVSVGVGTFNQGQIGYFDDVQISHAFGGGLSQQFDFGPVQDRPPVAIPALNSFGIGFLLTGLLVLGVLTVRERIS